MDLFEVIHTIDTPTNPSYFLTTCGVSVCAGVEA